MTRRVAIIGAGPAGLMAAEVLANNGIEVDIYDAMPSPARKFLMAGKSGLNISHSEPPEMFETRYRAPDNRLTEIVRGFGPSPVMDWMRGLGVDPIIGSTGRVFPSMMKASPLLRAWLARLGGLGVRLHRRHRWIGWTGENGHVIESPDGRVTIHPDAVIFALGGASWSRLGSSGQWLPVFALAGIETSLFKPSNCGFMVNWSERMKTDFSGAPVKNVALVVEDDTGRHETRAEFVVTSRGVESGGVYWLSAHLRNAIEHTGAAELQVDILPDMALSEVRSRLKRPRGKTSLGNHLRKVLGLDNIKRALLFECAQKTELSDLDKLAIRIKCLPVTLTAPAPMDEAISTTGGVSWAAMDDQLMLNAMPGQFCAGEMIDWDAPTGGYLLTACLAMGRVAGKGVIEWLDAQDR